MRVSMFYILCLSCCLSCHNAKKSGTEKNKPKKTIITGKLINYHPQNVAVQKIDPYDFNLITLRPAEYQYIQEADSFHMVFELNRPTEVMMWFKTMYVSPGDSVHLVYDVKVNTKNKRVDTLQASGKHNANYDFFWNTVNKARKDFGSVFYKNGSNYTRHIDQFRRDYERVYHETLHALDNQYKKVDMSEDALNYLKKKILGIYMANLALPVAHGKIARDRIPNNYFKGLDPEVLSDSLQLAAGGLGEYLLSLSLINPDITPYSPAHFKRYLELINKYAKGFNRDYLFYGTVRQFTEHRNWQFTKEMETAYNQMLATVVDSVCKQHIIQLGFNPNEALFRATEALKAVALQDKEGKQITFGDMVNRHLHHVIYIDIWASWCKPCRAEMPYARKTRKTYQNKPVSFVYLSIDKDKQSWKEAVDEEQLQDIETSYVLENPNDFGVLRKEFKFTGIPHYVLIDPKGNMAFVNAPRPSSDQLQTTLDNLLIATPGGEAQVPPPPPKKL